MNTTPNTNSPDASTAEDDARREELEERFLLAYERGEALRDWIARYPQYARELAELALAMDAQRVLPNAPAEEVEGARSATLKALETLTIEPPVRVVGLIERAHALGMKLPELAKRLQLTPDLLIKLDRGYVRLETVPRRFLAHVAQGLQTTVDALVAGLPTAPRLATGAAFYTKDRPQTAQQQSFATALQQATALPEAERARWLAAAREEGLAA